MKTEEITTFQPQIISFLTGRAGEVISPRVVARYLKVGEASVQHFMLNMELEGHIRKGRTAKNTLGFFMPTKSQLMAEEAAAGKTNKFNPLRTDKRKAELLEQIRAEREKYRSIG